MILYVETILEVLSAVRPVTAGATSLIAAMADEIGLTDIIDGCCEWDETRYSIPPARPSRRLPSASFQNERCCTASSSSTRARMWRRSSERGSQITISTMMPLAQALTSYWRPAPTVFLARRSRPRSKSTALRWVQLTSIRRTSRYADAGHLRVGRQDHQGSVELGPLGTCGLSCFPTGSRGVLGPRDCSQNRRAILPAYPCPLVQHGLAQGEIHDEAGRKGPGRHCQRSQEIRRETLGLQGRCATGAELLVDRHAQRFR